MDGGSEMESCALSTRWLIWDSLLRRRRRWSYGEERHLSKIKSGADDMGRMRQATSHGLDPDWTQPHEEYIS